MKLRALMLALLPAVAPATAQRPLALIRTLENDQMFRVRAAAVEGGRIVVLTGAVPFVHVYEGSGHSGWGRSGRGPAELLDPQGIAFLRGNRVLIRDSDLRKIATYSLDGSLLATRGLASSGMVVRFELVGGDTIVDLFSPGGAHVLARLRGVRADTILQYSTAGPTVRLAAPGGPSLTIPTPFLPTPAWAPLSDGRIAQWDGRGNAITVLGRSGETAYRMPLPRGRFPVTREDRESWFATAIPGEIRGQREPFRGLASEARRTVRFPASLPPVLQLKADPRGGVWVQQTLAATGQRWVYLAPGQPQTWFRLPAGETLLAVGLGEVVVLSRDADDVEVIRVYASPFPATP